MKYCLYPTDRERTIKAITSYLASLPVDKAHTVTITDYDESRSNQQNALYYKLLSELAKQGDSTIDEYRAISKLEIGVPIMRQDDDFRAKYDAIVRPLPYETKIGIMKMDFPVTSLMTVEQMQVFIDNFYMYWAQRGYILNQPGES